MAKKNSKKLSIQQLLTKNRDVDASELTAIRELRVQHRRLGRRKAVYDLAAPFERRRVMIGSPTDPRMVKLQNSIDLTKQLAPRSPAQE
jgi:hypothetical protein